jgi:hypothetical protein
MFRCACSVIHIFNGQPCCCHALEVEKEGDICQICKNGTHAIHPKQIIDPTLRDRCKRGENIE